jgi:hypothetical protein
MNLDWAAWGPAGLFAVFTLVLLKLFLNFIVVERSAIITNQLAIIATLAKIDVSLEATVSALIKHDSRVTATMEVMARSVGWGLTSEPKVETGVGEKDK